MRWRKLCKVINNTWYSFKMYIHRYIDKWITVKATSKDENLIIYQKNIDLKYYKENYNLKFIINQSSYRYP